MLIGVGHAWDQLRPSGRRGCGGGTDAMEECQRSRRIESAGEIAITSAIAGQLAGCCALEEDLADIERIKAIALAACHGQEQRSHSRDDGSGKTGSARRL